MSKENPKFEMRSLLGQGRKERLTRIGVFFAVILLLSYVGIFWGATNPALYWGMQAIAVGLGIGFLWATISKENHDVLQLERLTANGNATPSISVTEDELVVVITASIDAKSDGEMDKADQLYKLAQKIHSALYSAGWEPPSHLFDPMPDGLRSGASSLDRVDPPAHTLH